MKILLVDDHALFRDGLAMLIQHAFDSLVLLQAGSIAAAQTLLDAHPDTRIVLLDLTLPDSKGLATLARVREHAPHCTVVVLSADDSPETILAAIDAGAAGFIPKTAQSNVMRAALETVLAGGVYLPPRLLQQSSHHPPSPPALFGAAANDDALDLSPRQRDVLRLLVQGKSNKMICREIDLSESTVKTHLAAIFRRLEVSSRTQAVVVAARLGLRLHPDA